MNAKYTIGTGVTCSDGPCGVLARVIVDPVARTLTHLVVEPEHARDTARLVPVELVDPDSTVDAISLGCDRERFDLLEYAQIEEFLPAGDDELGYGRENTLWMPYFPYGGMPPGPLPPAGSLGVPADPVPRVVSEERVPLGEVQIRRGQPVHAADGDIGKVRGLAVDPDSRHVTHVLLEEGHLWGKKTVAIPIGAVESVKEGIQLRLSKDEVRDLPEIELGNG